MLLTCTLFTSRCLVLKINWWSLRNDPRPGCIFVVFMFLTNPNFRPVCYRNFVTKKKWFISLYIITLLWYVCLATITTYFQGAIKMYRFQLWNIPDLRISFMWKFSCYRTNSALCPETMGSNGSIWSASGIQDPPCTCLQSKPVRVGPQPVALPTNSAIQ